MAEPALQYDEFEDIEPIEIPAGGIATFLTAKEGMFADDDNIPQGGIAQVKAVADQLAEFGRHEDEYMVHAAHGETVIPMEVFRKNPILKENIYKQMRDMGLEPERYVVGSEFNSINPVTGQPEFFLKKLFKGIKKVFKVVAPTLLTIGLNAIPGIGTIAAAALSGGIMGLASGQGIEGALKGAALGGLTAGIFKGVSGAMGAAKEGGNVLRGAKAGFLAGPQETAFAAGRAAVSPDVLTPTAGLQVDLSDQLTAEVDLPTPEINVQPTDVASTIDTRIPDNIPVSNVSATAPTTTATPFDATAALKPTEIDLQPLSTLGQPGAGIPTAGTLDASRLASSGTTLGASSATVADAAATAPIRATTPIDAVQRILGVDEFKGNRNILGGLKDLFLPGGTRTEAEIRSILAERGITEAANPALFKSELTRLARRGLVERALPLGIAALGIGSLTAEKPTDFNVAERVTGEDLLAANPNRFSPGPFLPRPSFTIKTLKPEDFVVPTTASVYKPVPGVAEGGPIDENIFPRMMGPIEGPGTETSDDIPAMLSDGEFVMTAKAVRGAGNGSRQEGMKNMYQMMSNFESRA
jgi:hypothetical protein